MRRVATFLCSVKKLRGIGSALSYWCISSPSRPSPGSAKRTSATASLRSLTFILHFVRMWICYVSCLRLRLPPAKHSPSARRPRSRLGIPARLRRSGGRHRFRRSSSPPVQARRFAATFSVSPPPAFIHARITARIISFSLISRRQPARLRSLPIRITPLLFATPTKCEKKQPPLPKRRAAVAAGERSNLCFPAERPLAGSVKKTIAVAPTALALRPGSSILRRQPARLRS